MTEVDVVLFVIVVVGLIVYSIIPKEQTSAHPLRAGWQFARQQQSATPRPPRFSGCMFAVVFVQPNGSVSGLEAEVINQLLREGAECVPIAKSQIRETIRNGGNVSFPEGQMLIGGIVKADHMEVSVDFRCFTSDGRICGAGYFQDGGLNSLFANLDTLAFLDNPANRMRRLAIVLTSRIRVEKNDQTIVIQVDNGRAITLPVRTQ